MKKLMKKIEDLMVAVTFAEAGEYDEASRHAGPAEENESLSGFKKTAFENAGK